MAPRQPRLRSGREKLTVIMMVGLQGAGKTTTTAKIAGKLKTKGKEALLATCDVYRPGCINGFSHTHLSGTGCGDYGDVLLMPTVGRQDYHAMGEESQQMAYASAFSHENETAQPGYYSVFLDRYKVKAELTATRRAAIHFIAIQNPDDDRVGRLILVRKRKHKPSADSPLPSHDNLACPRRHRRYVTIISTANKLVSNDFIISIKSDTCNIAFRFRNCD